MQAKKSLIVYIGQPEIINELPLERGGKLYLATWRYMNGGNPSRGQVAQTKVSHA